MTTAGPNSPAGAVPSLAQTVIDIERHAAASGWDQAPRLYALVDTAELLTHEPQLAGLGLSADAAAPGQLTPVEQEDLPAGALDEVLAGISWPPAVRGCALVQEIVMQPADADDQLPPEVDLAAWTAARPDRREARLVVGVLRDESRAAALRVRPEGFAAESDPTDERDVLSGADLAPNLAAALLATLD
jgi:hypothetical protein